MGKLTRNSLPSHSLQAEMHRRIKLIPGFNKRLQGLLMQEFREVVEEPNLKAVRFAEALCQGPFDNEWGHCHQCGHGSNSQERHSDDCAYQEALKFLGRPVWVGPPEPKHRMKKVCGLYLKPGMHLVVDDCLCKIKSVLQGDPDIEVIAVTETDITETFHFTAFSDVYILENE